MRYLRVSYRLGLIGLIVLYGLGITLVRMAGRDPRRAFEANRPVIRGWMALLTRAMGLRLRIDGDPRAGPVLMVANHISWLDIIVLGATLPPRFLSKAEVRRWPLIGWLSACTGTLYIRRGSRDGAASATEAIRYALRHDARVMIFPEGTTSDGRSVRRFHSRLYQAAVDVGAPVQAVAVHYGHPDGIHPKVPWIDDARLLPSLLGILSEPRIDAEVHFGGVYPSAGAEGRTLARRTEEEIRAFVEQRSGTAARPEVIAREDETSAEV